jgi:hypothetical protein
VDPGLLLYTPAHPEEKSANIANAKNIITHFFIPAHSFQTQITVSPSPENPFNSNLNMEMIGTNFKFL